jgi:hypothetical protein
MGDRSLWRKGSDEGNAVGSLVRAVRNSQHRADRPPDTAIEAPHRAAAQEALDRYNQAMERLKSGDWAGFGSELESMRGVEIEPEVEWHQTSNAMNDGVAGDRTHMDLIGVPRRC